ncbi:hypothetical protein ACM01_41675 [Streptomyces viridochromogenes]|uniref:Uncharacterized protein n=1 Tax=Streptomyces viridochromogenes TaxID=1938 RepID=A0A0J7YVP3_STRVR|nr:hypothetical protein [Streptomyces viridochromogenes]KMS67731.1 hypothetical protein ACM01_41675 [Streptomyces viridochromogenes]
MALHAQQFFDDVLELPHYQYAIVGDALYAAPQPNSVLRLRIDFASTIRHGEYDGLRLRVIHPEQGVLDTAILRFADHGTFARRDAARDLVPGRDGYAVIRDWHPHSSQPPWHGADGTGLRTAIEQYTHFWFPPLAVSRPAARPVTQPTRLTGASPRSR